MSKSTKLSLDYLKKFKGGKFFAKNILYNRFVLYFIFLLVLVNLYSFGMVGNYKMVALFILVGVLTSFFSRNMIVILLVALVFTNVFSYTAVRYGRREGLANEEEDTMEDTANKKKSNNEKEGLTAEEEEEEQKKKEETMKNQYKELEELQGKILENMENIEGPLSKAENIVKKMKQTVNM
jgi:hypothetical protein